MKYQIPPSYFEQTEPKTPDWLYVVLCLLILACAFTRGTQAPNDGASQSPEASVKSDSTAFGQRRDIRAQ